MLSESNKPQTPTPAAGGLARAETPDNPPSIYDAGIIWPHSLGVGSLEDVLQSVKKTKTHDFLALEGLLNKQRLIIFTPVRALDDQQAAADAYRSMVRAMLSTHKPRRIICAAALQVEQKPGHTDDAKQSQPAANPWEQTRAVCLASSITSSEGEVLPWSVSEELRNSQSGEPLAAVPWFDAAAAWLASENSRLVTERGPTIVHQECGKRDVQQLAIGVVRWPAGQQPSRELADYRESDSRAKKFGRMLNWVVKNRAAIKETAKAAQDDLLAADKLAAAICSLIQRMDAPPQ